jgi:pantothenate kinase-related protein Tda10
MYCNFSCGFLQAEIAMRANGKPGMSDEEVLSEVHTWDY